MVKIHGNCKNYTIPPIVISSMEGIYLLRTQRNAFPGASNEM